MESDESLWIVLQIGFVLLLVALNGFFVAAEFALVKIRDSQIKPLIRKGNRKAIMTQKVLDHLDASLSCLLYTSPSPRDKRQSRMPSSA